MCVVCTQVLAVFLYLAMFLLAKRVFDLDIYDNTTIYTQAIQDWETQLWADFSWGENGKCDDGYDWIEIINEWPGTVEGNFTNDGDGVKPTNPRYTG